MLPHRVVLLAFYILSFQVYWLKRRGAYPLLHVLVIIFNLRFLVPHLRWLAPLPNRTHRSPTRYSSRQKVRSPSPKLPDAPRPVSPRASPPIVPRPNLPVVSIPIPQYADQPLPPQEAFLEAIPGLKAMYILPGPQIRGRLAPRMVLMCSDGVGLVLHREIAMMYSSVLGHTKPTSMAIPLRLPDIVSELRLPDAVNIDGANEDIICSVRKIAVEAWRFPRNRSRWPQLAVQGKLPYPVHIFHVEEASNIMISALRPWYLDTYHMGLCHLSYVAKVLEAVQKYDIHCKLLSDAIAQDLRARIHEDAFAVYDVATAAQLVDIRLEAAQESLRVARYDATAGDFVTDLPGALALKNNGGKPFEDLVRFNTKCISASLAIRNSATWIREIPSVLTRTSTCESMQLRKFGKRRRARTWYAHSEVWRYLDEMREGLRESMLLVVKTSFEWQHCKHCGCVGPVEAQNALKDMVAKTVEMALGSCRL
ncbi:hypothetical protein PENSPDRAFT_651778 [Peniophora sp. CONT]|nr:hypothetical protein PENSPDRAFT_651778 [Peniophora sp. CONT]